MTVEVKKAYVVVCTECPQATAAKPIIVQARDKASEADEWADDHRQYHVDKARMTDDALSKARFARAAIAKLQNTDNCQCFCPQVGVEHTCAEADREVVVHFPPFIAGMKVRAAVMCNPCATAWQQRMNTAVNEGERLKHLARFFTKDDTQHLACFDLVTGEELKHAVQGDDPRGEDPGSGGEGASSGSGPDDGDVHVPASAGAPSESEPADL